MAAKAALVVAVLVAVLMAANLAVAWAGLHGVATPLPPAHLAEPPRQAIHPAR
jgi:hypothetical protein